MKNTIWKYSLVKHGFNEKIILSIPKGAMILCVQRDEKDNQPCIWMMVNPLAEHEDRTFETFGTGHDIKSDIGVDRNYIGTYQYQNGQFVGHVFERIN